MAITKATASSIAPATKGDLVVGSATNDAAVLAVGTNNYVLTADSAEATGLKWAAPAGGGKVLQVVQGTYSTLVTVASTTFTDTGLSLSITPTSNTSKIFILVNQNFQTIRSADQSISQLRILRGSTSVFEPGARNLGNNYINGASSSTIGGTSTFAYLDSPATTSATTYKTQGSVADISSSGMVRFQLENASSVMTLMEIGA